MTEVRIVDSDDALVVRTRRTGTLFSGAFSATAAGVVAGFAASYVMGPRQRILLALVAAAVAFLYSRRTRNFELRVTSSQFVAIGQVGDNFGGRRSVSAPDVRWLEYQEDTTGPETAHHPQGLYAVLRHRSMCLLPEVDAQQCAHIIDRVTAKYPEFEQQWSGQSSFGTQFISLELNEERPRQ
jgi:hypothetical protein